MLPFATILFVGFLVSCSPKYVTVSFHAPDDEKYETPALQTYFSKNTKPVIMLRTPLGGESDILNNSGFTKSFYSNLEKSFLEKGFTVRDRGLFETILTQSQYTDYSKMTELTGTDIIIEIVGIEKTTYCTRDLTTTKGKKIRVGNCSFCGFDGYRIEIKVVMIKDNTLAGNYVFNYAPNVDGIKYIVSEKNCKLTVYKPSSALGEKPKEVKPAQTILRNGINAYEVENLANKISETIIHGVMK